MKYKKARFLLVGGIRKLKKTLPKKANDTPNINDPANATANQLYKTNKSAYNQKIKQEAKKQST